MRRYLSLFVICTALMLGNAVVAADGVFIAIGGVNGKAADGHQLEGQFGTIYTSVDGETWKQVFKGGPVTTDFSHAQNNLLRCLTFGNGRLVVIGNPHAVIVSENASSGGRSKLPAAR